jgi:hypothetical protein
LSELSYFTIKVSAMGLDKWLLIKLTSILVFTKFQSIIAFSTQCRQDQFKMRHHSVLIECRSVKKLDLTHLFICYWPPSIPSVTPKIFFNLPTSIFLSNLHQFHRKSTISITAEIIKWRNMKFSHPLRII